MTLVHTTVILQARQEPLNSRASDLSASSVAEGLLCCPDRNDSNAESLMALPELDIGHLVTPRCLCVGLIHDSCRALRPQPLR
jgi:hypothetical protein